MSISLFKIWSRKALLLSGLALGLSQVGCTHPVVMEPSVVVSSQIGHAPVYPHVGVHGPVIYTPVPARIYVPPPPPPRVIYVPPVYRVTPGWHGHDRRWGHGHSRRDDTRDGGRHERWDDRRDDHHGHR